MLVKMFGLMSHNEKDPFHSELIALILRQLSGCSSVEEQGARDDGRAESCRESKADIEHASSRITMVRTLISPADCNVCQGCWICFMCLTLLYSSQN